MTPILIYALCFTCLTSLLLGYDSCIVSSLLSSIESDFHLCGFNSSSIIPHGVTHSAPFVPAPQLDCIEKSLFVSVVSPGAAVSFVGKE